MPRLGCVQLMRTGQQGGPRDESVGGWVGTKKRPKLKERMGESGGRGPMKCA